jgi:two-component system chemotaxis response regulator CheB
MAKIIRVLVVDDSAVMRELLTEILNSDPEIAVVGSASDPYEAREKIKALNPDVLTLDVEMPRMDGLMFLSNLMRLRPMPVVMCASVTQRGADLILNALDLGAVDFIAKPTARSSFGIRDAAQEIIGKVKVAAAAHIRTAIEVPKKHTGEASALAAAPSRANLRPDATRRTPQRNRSDRLIAIGASTGGTEAIKEVLTRLPHDTPPVVIVQHIPKAFSGAFAARMDDICEITVCEASDGQPLLPGHAYIAPGDLHLIVAPGAPAPSGPLTSGVQPGAMPHSAMAPSGMPPSGMPPTTPPAAIGRYQCRLSGAEPVNRHRPSADVLFRSVARVAGANGIGLLLTGMGRDGAAGLKEMLMAGASTLAQDEASSVVWGMPGAAWELGAVQSLHPLLQIADKIMALLGNSHALHRDMRSA